MTSTLGRAGASRRRRVARALPPGKPRRASTAAGRSRGESCCKSPLKVDPLDSVVFAIDHMNTAATVDRERPRIGQLARLSARAAPAAERFPVERELLDPMVAVLHHIEVRSRAGGEGEV